MRQHCYKFINQQHQMVGVLDMLMAFDAWGFDTETTGLRSNHDKVILVQLGRGDMGVIIDTRYVDITELKLFFLNKQIKKVGHNLKFDYKMMKGSFGIEMEGLRCTYIAERMIHMGKRYFKGMGCTLENVILDRMDIQLDKTVQKSFIGHKGAFSQRQLQYAEEDVCYLNEMYAMQVKDMTRLGIGKTFIIECESISSFGDMEHDGMILDVPAWRTVLNENIEKQKAIELELNTLIEPYVSPNLFGETHINYASTPQVLELMQTMRIRIPETNKQTGEVTEKIIKKTDKQTFKKIGSMPFVKKLQEWRGYAVRIGTFGQAYIDAVDPVTGAIHPDLYQLGTETGRPAAGDSAVNPLNIPSSNKYRHCFICRADEVVESDDYSGCESRILAHISGDPVLQGIFARGEDIHCAVASMMYGIEVTKDNENKKYRKPAKSLNFGIAYGMGPFKLWEDLNGEGFPITLDEAKKLYYKYCDIFKVAVGFLRDSGKLAFEQGYLENINGRRRYWKKPIPEDFVNGIYDEEYKAKKGSIEREGGNFLIQSVNADITKAAMTEIRKYAKENGIRTHFINAVYDEIVTRTHKDDSERFHAMKLKIMQDVAETMITTVPMLVDGFVGPYWNK